MYKRYISIYNNFFIIILTNTCSSEITLISCSAFSMPSFVPVIVIMSD